LRVYTSCLADDFTPDTFMALVLVNYKLENRDPRDQSQ
jgi:hypothetical protein